MTEPPAEHPDLEPGIPPAEQLVLVNLAAQLRHQRPAPPAAFRGSLRAQIAATLGTLRIAPRPRWLWPRVAGCATLGAGLLLLVAAGTGGAGPFAV